MRLHHWACKEEVKVVSMFHVSCAICVHSVNYSPVPYQSNEAAPSLSTKELQTLFLFWLFIGLSAVVLLEVHEPLVNAGLASVAFHDSRVGKDVQLKGK